MLDVREDEEGVRFAVRVSPRASRAAIVGLHGEALKVSLAAPPVEGQANAALCELLAKALKVPKSNVHIVQGERSRTKTVRVSGVRAADVSALLK